MFDRLTNREIAEKIAELAAEIAALTASWLALIAEFDARGAYLKEGFHSCAHWLSWRCSIATRTAREHVRVAQRLAELPLVREAFSTGELSYSKVRAITRVEEEGLEEHMLDMARKATAAQLDKLVQGMRRARSAAEVQVAHQRRHFNFTWGEDGCLSFRGKVTAEEGALLLRALEAGRDALNERDFAEAKDLVATPAQSGSAEPPEPRRASNADALVMAAESLLSNGPAARPAGERYQVVLHVDAEALNLAHEHDGRCEIDDGPAVCAETARRLACDASVVRMHDGPEGTISVGRKTRAIPPSIRRALRSRDGGCRFPGCTNHRWVDGHHIEHWADGGETKLDNLVQLCRRHHRLLHEGGFTVEPRADGSLLFCRPDGAQMPLVPPPVRRTRNSHRKPARSVAQMPLPICRGEQMNYDMAVSGMLARARPLEPAGHARDGPLI
jgi:uncharacterized protein DUF222/HNH endonuclease